MEDSKILGVDVGASGIKAAVIDIQTGAMLTERVRFPTPNPSTPEAMAATFAELVKRFEWTGLIGCGFPTLVRDGIAISASNLDASWIGQNVDDVFSRATNCPVKVLNDADAAGMAELHFGKGINTAGTIIFITIGTGLGSALFIDGKIVPNTEFGQLYLKGQENLAEQYASNSAKERDNLTWKQWAKRFDEYLHHLDLLFSPSLILLGGGTSKYFNEYARFLTLPIPVKPAQLLNSAGMIGAAYYAYETVHVYAR